MSWRTPTNNNQPVNTALCPSRLFGGPNHRHVPNIAIRHGEDPATGATSTPTPAATSGAWRPIDGTINAAALGFLYHPPHLAHTVYVSRDILAVPLITLAWDTPPSVYVYGGLFPPGWHECRAADTEMITKLCEGAAMIEAGDTAMDEWKRAEVMGRVRTVLRLWDEAQVYARHAINATPTGDEAAPPAADDATTNNPIALLEMSA